MTKTPLWILITSVLCMIVAEFVVMIILSFSAPRPLVWEAILDSILLGILSVPLLFFLLFRPLLLHIQNQKSLEDALQKSHYELNRKVEEQTKSINQINAELQIKVDELLEVKSKLQDNILHLNSIIDNLPTCIKLVNPNGTLLEINPAGLAMIAASSRVDVIGKNVYDLIHEADRDSYKQFNEKVCNGQKGKLAFRINVLDGSEHHMETVAVPLKHGPTGEFVQLAFTQDVTLELASQAKNAKLESQLKQAQKMESIGTLAGGIAHDLNNVLTPLFGYLELAMLRVEADSELIDELTEVRKAADRAKEMVKQILTFSRRESETLSPTHVHVIVKEALKLLRASIPTTIEFRQNIDPNCGTVLANPTQIHQILMNLCTNAFHSMRETGGVLGVSLMPIEIYTKDCSQNINLQPGPYLKLEVIDTGHGMDKETMDRIFEPYFTTKDRGEGTGMGLSVIHGIVKSVGGHISVYSELGKGSTFHIYFPVYESSAVQTENLCEKPAPTGTERILLVDDEEMVRKVEKAILTGLGYTVTAFSNPLEALEQFMASPESFDLLITDVTMPKMTGDQLAHKVMEIRPDMPVILCSGFSELINEGSTKTKGIKGYISKPIIRHSFSSTIRNVLDGVVTEEN